jgi:hypothetical protein
VGVGCACQGYVLPGTPGQFAAWMDLWTSDMKDVTYTGLREFLPPLPCPESEPTVLSLGP